MKGIAWDGTKYTGRDLHYIATKVFRKLREERGLSLTQLSAELGINYNTLGAYERGDRACTLDQAEIILNFYGYELTVSRRDT